MVLPSYIIEQINRRERERGRPQPNRQPQIEIDDRQEMPERTPGNQPAPDPRGIAEIDIGNRKEN